MIELENYHNESCSSNLVFLRENHFQWDSVAISPQKLTLNFENALFLSAHSKIWVTDFSSINQLNQVSVLWRDRTHTYRHRHMGKTPASCVRGRTSDKTRTDGLFSGNIILDAYFPINIWPWQMMNHCLASVWLEELPILCYWDLWKIRYSIIIRILVGIDKGIHHFPSKIILTYPFIILLKVKYQGGGKRVNFITHLGIIIGA